MPARFVITATGTDIGKTLAAGALMLGLGASYWKPVQCGADPETDTDVLKRLTGLPASRFLPEAYYLKTAMSPHRAGELEEKEIDFDHLVIPPCDNTLLIEGAGGLMVPLTRKKLMIDLFARWQAPLILCARTELGTINHTLLSVEAIRARKIPLHGIVFLGEDNPDTIKTIAEFSGARVLGHIPSLTEVNASMLKAAFTSGFDPAIFKA